MRPLGIRWWSLATVARCLVLVFCGLVAGAAPNASAFASAASRHTPTVPQPLTLALYDTETNDRAQLLAHLDLATQLAPTGFYVTAGGQLETRGDHRSIAELAHARSVQVYPVVQNYRDGSFHGEDLGWLASPMDRRAVTAATLRAVSDARVDGIDLDFENLPTALRQDFTRFVSELSARLHPAGERVLVDLPVDHAAYDSAQLARVSAWLILMAYDQHSLPGRPGPIAGRPWVHAALAQMRHEVPASKLVLGLPAYGYDWTPLGVEPLSYREVLRRAGTAGGIRWDAASSEPWFAYTDRDGTGHTVWFSDAPSLQPLLREARTAGLAGVSLWRLGLEDPATWAVLGRRARNAGRSTALAVVSVDPIRRGSGEVASIPQSSQEGRRVLTWDPAGEQVVAERYLSLPRPEEVLEVSNVPSSVLFGSWSANAPRKKGNFDVNMYASSPDIDPQETVAQRFACANIPRPVWLYNRSNIDAYRFTVGGYKDNGWDNFTWNTEDWFVSKK